MNTLPLSDGYNPQYERLRVREALETFDNLLYAASIYAPHWSLSKRRQRALQVLYELLDRALRSQLSIADLQAVEDWRNDKLARKEHDAH